jgi:hypothetical protein
MNTLFSIIIKEKKERQKRKKERNSKTYFNIVLEKKYEHVCLCPNKSRIYKI